MTEEHRRRIKDSIADCDRFIEREEARRADLRPKHLQEYLDYCREHRVRLQAMLDDAKS